jgi:stage V sporulation protein SpoVS
MEDGEEEVVLRISGKYEKGYVKRVAGAICWRLRDVGVAYLRAVKKEAIYNAIKAVARAQTKVAQADVVLAVDFSLVEAQPGKGWTASDSSRGEHAVEMTVREVTSEKPEEFVEYKVSGKFGDGIDKEADKLSAAICPLLRDGKGARLRCIGASSVNKGVRGIIVAKGQSYANGIVLDATPVWTHMPGEGGKNDSYIIVIDVWGTRTIPASE